MTACRDICMFCSFVGRDGEIGTKEFMGGLFDVGGVGYKIVGRSVKGLCCAVLNTEIGQRREMRLPIRFGPVDCRPGQSSLAKHSGHTIGDCRA